MQELKKNYRRAFQQFVEPYRSRTQLDYSTPQNRGHEGFN